jgi:DNA-binding MarR family transcriptional regulator
MTFPPENSYERFLRAVHKSVYAIDRNADRLLTEKEGGTFSQFLILMAISQCSGLSQQKIAEFLDLTPAAISRQIDSLVKAELIVREQDPHSRRSHVVSLTPTGETRFRTMKSTLLDSFKESSAVPADELDAASEVLEKVVRAMHPTCSSTH